MNFEIRPTDATGILISLPNVTFEEGKNYETLKLKRINYKKVSFDQILTDVIINQTAESFQILLPSLTHR
jgi:hypothetical protein